MARVTSKRQTTIPKAIADQYDIRPGVDLTWVAAGDSILVIPPQRARTGPNVSARLRLFDEATRRQAERNIAFGRVKVPSSRGWTREDLYHRGRTGSHQRSGSTVMTRDFSKRRQSRRGGPSLRNRPH